MSAFKVEPVAGLTFNEPDHRYELNGKWIPGVTTLTSNLAKPWLVPWAAKMVAEKAKELIMPNTPYSAKELEKILLTAKQAPNKRKEGAADKGKIAHGWIEQFIKAEMDTLAGKKVDINQFPKLDSMDIDVRNSVEGFNAWREQYKPKWLASELLICSTKHEYAGTLDAIAEINGHITIVDFKTGRSVPDDIALQLAGYVQALSEMGGTIEARSVLHIPAEKGKKWDYRMVDEPIDFALDTFLHLRAIQKWVSFVKSNNGGK